MWILILVVAYIVVTYLTYKVLEWDWLTDFDMDRGDQIYFILLSALPIISQGVALLIIINRVVKPKINSEKIVKRRRR